VGDDSDEGSELIQIRARGGRKDNDIHVVDEEMIQRR
jgi:hypothetical protein